MLLGGTNVHLGIVSANNILFQGTAHTIAGASTSTITLGTTGDTINLNSSGVTYNVGNMTGSPTLTGSLTVTGDVSVGGNLIVPKVGYWSYIYFPKQTNDAGYIGHYENNNVSEMRFNVSDDPAQDVDYFTFGGSTGQADTVGGGTWVEGARITASGKATFKGLTSSGGLSVTAGATTLAGTLNVTGATTVGALTVSGALNVSGTFNLANGSQIVGTNTGVLNQSWLGFYQSDGTTRVGYVGDFSQTSNDMYINADSGNIILAPNGVAAMTLSSTDMLLTGHIFTNGRLSLGQNDYNSTLLDIVVPNTGTTMTGTNKYAGIHLQQTTTSGNFVGITASGRSWVPGANTMAGILFEGVTLASADRTQIHFLTADSYTNGMQNRMTLDYGGNLGIGTTTPKAKLHVSSASGGTSAIFGSSVPVVLTNSSAGIAFNQYYASGWKVFTGGSYSGDFTQTPTTGAFTWNISTSATATADAAVTTATRMTLAADGKLAIAQTTAPTLTLTIGDSDTGINWASDGQLDHYANNTFIMRVNTSGLNMQKPITLASGAAVQSLNAGGQYAIEMKSHNNATWFRNEAGQWIFQSGTVADAWDRSFQFYQSNPATAGNNDQWFEIGQRQINSTTNGTYKGVRLTKYVGGAIVDGDLQAATVAVTGGLTVSNGFTMIPGGPTTAVGSVFSGGDTYKSYINLNAASGSNDPGFIMYETSSIAADTNKGVIHLSPSDDNDNVGDYVTIHGTNDPEAIRLFTGGNIYSIGNLNITGTGTNTFSGMLQSINYSVTASDGRGYRFWDSDNYKIFMSAGGSGGRIPGETTSDYNMYFKMTGSGTNRGFVFQTATGNVAGIDQSGKVLTEAGVRIKNKFEMIYNATEDSLDFMYG
jgi:hypothetical protein